jgi:phosphotransferase system enzyme I (PtsP)
MPTQSIASAREILTGLHEVMASKLNAQAKLNKVVQIIAEAMSSEVCSIYLLRDGLFELFATVGLNQSAVHVTRLAHGEGLVGTIAREVSILNLAEAVSHPNSPTAPKPARRRSTALPACRSSARSGRWACSPVQHADPRAYEEVEIEALQTVAMVLSELIANAGLIDRASNANDGKAEQGMAGLRGLKLVTGMARGVAVYHQPRILIEHTVAEDLEAERHRVYSAFRRMREQIETMTTQAEFGTAGEHHEVLETYKMFAYDEGWSRRINESIDQGLTAEAAIERVRQRMKRRMQDIDDPLLQERMHDLDDLSNRLLRIVSGQLGTAAQAGLPHEAILVARNLGPAELLEYDRRKLKGVILQEGSLTAHVTIVARAMGVPMMGRVPGARQQISEGDLVLLDGDEPAAFVRPTPSVEQAFDAKLEAGQKRRAAFAALRDVPPVTKDGTRLTVMVNAGLRDDVAAVGAVGADGIGLFRTEFQFLVSATLPRRESQQRLYRSVLEAADGKPVIFRTVDVGGDKQLPYLPRPQPE